MRRGNLRPLIVINTECAFCGEALTRVPSALYDFSYCDNYCKANQERVWRGAMVVNKESEKLIRGLKKSGWPSISIQEYTGIAKETIRRILND